MRVFFILTLVLISKLGLSQAFKSVDATIIKPNNDTIRSKVRVYSNIFKKTQINEASFFKNVVLVDENMKKIEKIKARDISKLSFIDLNGINRVYVNDGDLTFKELMFDGKKIKWYRRLYQNLYDSSINYDDYLVDINDKVYRLGLFNNIKNKLIEATKSKPELEKEILNSKLTRDNILEILRKYDE